MKRHHGLFVLAALGLAVVMAGCWGSSKSTSVDVSAGESPIATATAVGIDVCHNCHANTAVNGVGIFDAWAASRHGNNDGAYANLPPVNFSGNPPAECSGCHDPNGDSLNLALYLGAGSTPAPRNVVGCEACHGGGSLHFGVGPIGGPRLGVYAVAASAGQSSQYNTCISCHVERNSIHDPSQPPGTVDNIIYDTHFDNGVGKYDDTTIEGYVIRKALNTACTDCHIGHEFDLAENRQWHSSAHGDFNGAAWRHYKWTAANRRDCQRCHTTTGFVNYTNDQASYNPANNVFVAVDNQAELLYCYGCHQVDAGGMLAARRSVDNAYLPAGPGINDTVVISGMGDSELCINCHSGREPGSQVKINLANSTTGPDNTNFGAFNSHYLLAAATLFQDNIFSAADNQFVGPGAYQFVGKDYAKPSDFAHDLIGTSEDPSATDAKQKSQGPCVGCHMTSPAGASNDPTYGSHIFLPIHEDATGVIDNVTSTRCVGCHVGPGELTAVRLQTSRTNYRSRIAELKTALDNVGIYYNQAKYPYFYADAASTTQFKTWATKAASLTNPIPTEDLVGVAFNLNYFSHEPGAWAHNDAYAYRVLYDSIEKLGATPSFARP